MKEERKQMKKAVGILFAFALMISVSLIPGKAEAANTYFESEVVRLTNIERQKVGVAPVKSDSNIAYVARTKAEDMRDNNYFSHYSPTYGDPFVMMQDFGIVFTKAGENIAARQTSPSAVVQSWMNSDTHRETLLNPAYTRLGVGYAQGGYLDHYWVQMFAN